MNTQRIIVLGIALVAAGGAAFLVRGMLGGGAQVAAAKPAPQIAMSEVLVANVNLTPGQALTAEQTVRSARCVSGCREESSAAATGHSGGRAATTSSRRRAGNEPVGDGLGEWERCQSTQKCGADAHDARLDPELTDHVPARGAYRLHDPDLAHSLPRHKPNREEDDRCGCD